MAWSNGDRLILELHDEVAQVRGSGGHSGNWKAYWIRHSGRQWPSTCQMHGCGSAATDGAHVYVKHLQQVFILPTCHWCNVDKENKYYRGATEWASAKANALAVRVEAHKKVRELRTD